MIDYIDTIRTTLKKRRKDNKIMASKVYFADLRADYHENLQQKLTRLLKTAGMGDIDFNEKFVAIKLHFGEPGNLSFLRPNYAKAVADVVKELGGIPFLTDCNTLYVGRRKHALEHLEAAQENGFSPLSTGCQIIIADGLKGTDEVEVPVEGGEYVTAAKIGRAVMDADVFISLAHFKGHDSTGFGGAIKNIGMGCGSRAGKMEQHCSGKVSVNPKRCRGCGACARNCAQGAISYGEDRKAVIDEEKCVGCGRCIGHCNFDAIRNNNFNAGELLNRKLAEYTKAVLAGRPGFHINMVIDISPSCDCCPTNDAPILPDIGMFASFDPVALDEACVDACNRQQQEVRQLVQQISVQLHTMYPCPRRVMRKSVRPMDSSLRRRRLMFTVSVLSSTNSSLCYSASMSFVRDTIQLGLCMRTCRILCSFFVSSTVFPANSSVPRVRFNTAPRWVSTFSCTGALRRSTEAMCASRICILNGLVT